MSSVVIAGNTSGSITISAPDVSGSNTLTLPVATDTLVGKATTDTLTNKTLVNPVLGAATATTLSVTGESKFTGNVGIGANIPNPQTNLELNSNVYTVTKLLTLSGSENTRYNAYASYGDVSGAGQNKFGWKFGTTNNNVDFPTMYITDGNVGIGTASLGSYRLKVASSLAPEALQIDSTSGDITLSSQGSAGADPNTRSGGVSVYAAAFFNNSGAGKMIWNSGTNLLLTNSNYGSGTGQICKLALNTSNGGYNNGAIIHVEGAGGYDQGHLVFSTGWDSTAKATERMRINNGGSLILAGSIAQKATGTTWSNPSDIRLKDNIIDYSKGLDKLMQVNVKEWTYNGKGGTIEGLKGLGVIADEIMEVLPNTVDNYRAKLNADDESDTDIKKFDATEITWLMLNSIQELKAIVDTQAEQIKVLQGK